MSTEPGITGLFRCHEIKRAKHSSRLGHPASEMASKAEIQKFRLAVRGKLDVGGLDVTIH